MPRLPGKSSALWPVLATLFTILAISACQRGVRLSDRPAPDLRGGSFNLTLFHTNDMHGAFLPRPATWREDRALTGGMVALQWHLGAERKTTRASLLLDAGDFMTGNPICDIPVDGVKGAGLMDMMNAVGYDVGVIGNHEFDLGRANARGLAARANFPLLAGDILDESGEPEFTAEPIVLERGGLRIGIMGVGCGGLFGVAARDRVAGLSLRDQAGLVRKMITELDDRTDLLVLITHNGLEGDRDLARKLAGSSLDVIVGGHSHSRLEQPEVVGDILIVQAGGHLTNLGRLDLRVEDDRVVEHSGRLIELAAAGTSAGPALTGLVQAYQARIEKDLGRVIATLQQDWRRNSRGESNVGNWLCDRLRERAQTDVAFQNSGGIRKNLSAGPVTLIDLKEMLPFPNRLVTFDLTGTELLTVLSENAQAAAWDRHGTLQVSGVRYGYREVGDHLELEAVTVGGEPLAKDRVYSVAAPDYVVAKAGVYFHLPEPEVSDLGITVTEIIIEAAEAAGTIDSDLDGRIRSLSR